MDAAGHPRPHHHHRHGSGRHHHTEGEVDDEGTALKYSRQGAPHMGPSEATDGASSPTAHRGSRTSHRRSAAAAGDAQNENAVGDDDAPLLVVTDDGSNNMDIGAPHLRPPRSHPSSIEPKHQHPGSSSGSGTNDPTAATSSSQPAAAGTKGGAGKLLYGTFAGPTVSFDDMAMLQSRKKAKMPSASGAVAGVGPSAASVAHHRGGQQNHPIFAEVNSDPNTVIVRCYSSSGRGPMTAKEAIEHTRQLHDVKFSPKPPPTAAYDNHAANDVAAGDDEAAAQRPPTGPLTQTTLSSVPVSSQLDGHIATAAQEALASPKLGKPRPFRQLSTQATPVPESGVSDIGSLDDPAPDVVEEERKTFSPLDDLSFTWTWIDVVGRDDDRQRVLFSRVAQDVTRTFGLCPSLLVERDFDLVMPQILEAATNDHQFLVVLRVANDKVHSLDDGMVQLTNRWLLVIDVDAKLVLTLHRIDTLSFAALRTEWTTLMKQRIAFEEFLVKLVDDAVNSYAYAVDVNAVLLDVCESKLCFSTDGKRLEVVDRERTLDARDDVRQRIRAAFVDGGNSKFFRDLLSIEGTINRGDMNRFLYHLHRRASVLYRVLNVTQPVLQDIFTELKLCSEDRAAQMCAHCTDLSAKAQEARDEAEHMLNMHIALVSFQTNELMSVLTKFSIFFAPLSFLTGLYGMNFENMPELHYRYGYHVFLACVLSLALFLWYNFHKRGVM